MSSGISGPAGTGRAVVAGLVAVTVTVELAALITAAVALVTALEAAPVTVVATR